MVARVSKANYVTERGKVAYHRFVPRGIDAYYAKFSSGERNVVFDDGTLESTSLCKSAALY
jgi:hypothetical protein